MSELMFLEGVILEFELREPCFRGCVRGEKTDSVLISDIDKGSNYWIEKEQLIELKRNNQIKVLSEQKDLGELTFVDLTDSEQQEVLRKYKYIKALEESGITVVNANNAVEVLERISIELDQKPPSWQSLWNWNNTFIKSGRRMRSLFPKHRNKGNKNQKIQDEVVEIIHKESKRFYSLNQPRMSTIVRNVQDRVRELNIKDSSLCLNVPTYPTVRDRVLNKNYSSRKNNRSGKRVLDAELASFDSGIVSSRVLERVEIDHTQLDIHLVHDDYKTLLGRPYITVLIDHYSSMVLGFQLTFEPPSFAAIQAACLNAFLDKSDFLKSLNVDAEWPAHGIPEIIVSDNGKEFWSENFGVVIDEIGSVLQYSPIRKANYKSRVERFFGVVNSMFLDDLPGVVRKKGKSGDGYDARQEAKLTFSEFERYFVEWLTKVYHHEPLSRNSMTAYELWLDSDEEFPVPREDAKKLVPILLGTKSRQLNRGGINLFDLRYESTALTDLYRREGQLKVTVKYNPFDIGHILVLDPLNKVFLKANATNYAYASGLSEFEHKKVKERAREIARIKSESPNLVAAKAKLARERDQIHERNKRRKTQVTTSKGARIEKIGNKELKVVEKVQVVSVDFDSQDEELDLTGWEVVTSE